VKNQRGELGLAGVREPSSRGPSPRAEYCEATPLRELAQSADSRLTVVYIAGTGRSGSTLLDQLLGDYLGAFSCGELNNILKAINSAGEYCSCGKLAGQCGFWSEVVADWRAAVPEFSETEYTALQNRFERIRSLVTPWAGRTPARESFQRYSIYTQALFAAIARHSGASIIVDSTKGPARALSLSKIPEIDLHMLHLVRDVRGVVNSWLQSCRLAQQQGTRGRVGFSDNVRPAVAWAIVNYFCERVQRRLPGDGLLVRYEDYSANPESAVDEIASVLGMQSAMRDTGCNGGERHVHQIAGNDMRLRPVTHIATDQAWHVRIAPAMQKALYLLVSPWMLRYRYRL
jgi:hypothetical protein